jgi:hypothetical protein
LDLEGQGIDHRATDMAMNIDDPYQINTMTISKSHKNIHEEPRFKNSKSELVSKSIELHAKKGIMANYANQIISNGKGI